MTPTGHKFTAAAMAVAFAVPVYFGVGPFEATLIFAGVMFGARAPDWSELAKWKDGVRYSLIPHRGPTHWPGWWLIGLYFSMYHLPSPYNYIGIGFFSSALLHLIMDIMTPTGIPLLHPFAKKVSFTIYKTGSFKSEGILVILCWMIAIFVSGPYLSV